MSRVVIEDPVWRAIMDDPQLVGARRKLSFHEIRLIIRHARGRFTEELCETAKQPTSPDPMKELCEALEAAVANFGDGEINTSNYSHDDVYHLNDQYVNLFSAVKSLLTALENAKGGGR